MNTITWKGVLSTTISGLLISELPPISKAPLRVSETTIDGKDGSIIEELGYEPYDKQMTIGLHGNFDIDTVIKYFNGEGDLILSNEPTKYYKAKIIGQIDYNRLIRFRTATVKFRVQPYKFKVNETAINLMSAGTVTNAGIEISKPKITLNGSGTVEIRLNDVSVFSYTFPENETQVIIDSELEEAYIGAELKNRNMNGEFITLLPGENDISWTGSVTSMVIEPKSRWI